MSYDIEVIRLNVAKAALQFIGNEQIIGIGTGKTVNVFIEQLKSIRHKIAGAVASSEITTQLLQAAQIPVIEFNNIVELPLYIDSADEYTANKLLIKGGGGALTREKILAYASKKFVCMVTPNKKVVTLGKFPVAIEVIPMARSQVARSIVKLGGQPEYRNNYITDNGNIILDVYGWEIIDPVDLEYKLKQITGIVESGIFAIRPADIILDQ